MTETKAENIFEEIANAAIVRKNKLMEKLSFRDKKKEEYNKQMTALANECKEIMTDPKYPRQQEFLNSAIETLQESLQHILVRDIKNLNRQDTLLMACTIAAQIEAFKKIMTRPQKVVKEVEEYQKMNERGKDNGQE